MSSVSGQLRTSDFVSLEQDQEKESNNGSQHEDSQEGNDVRKTSDVKADYDDDGLVSDSLRSPMQTRVRRISAELRLSASTNLDSIKKAGKGLSSGLHNVANKLPLPAMPKSLRRRSWHYEEVEENNLLDPESLKDEDGQPKLGILKSKSSENLKKTKDEKEVDGNREKSFLMRKWEARKNKDTENKVDKADEKKDDDVSKEELPTGNLGNDGLSVDSVPVVFEPLSFGQRTDTPVVMIDFEEATPKKSTNPFLD